jgi:hypothetical protein
MGTHAATTIRFTDEDREVLSKLCALTGLDSSASAIRLAIREALASRQLHRLRPVRKGGK